MLVDGQEMEYGLCPLMSGSPMPVRSSVLGGDGSVQIGTMLVPCVGEKCALWSDSATKCSLVSLSAVVRAIDRIGADQ